MQSVAEAPGRPGLPVVGGIDGVGEIVCLTFYKYGVADRRLVNDDDIGDDPVFDLEVNGYEVGKDDAPVAWYDLRS
ncbi:hypothetical protein [Mesorhizobium retamae]|uniref:Uncharacterized protein n=1 Tax=Mesorhizobium retamae TaxID=2912854 RepID=A0ABS9QGE5_9HYPH|nr:hypothetical protein [Mesorhizobium sp. IRAMC:0171]MCG7505836.1 hypothetical protein [Mesorhizobium sp. IRAMC:0171]